MDSVILPIWDSPFFLLPLLKPDKFPFPNFQNFALIQLRDESLVGNNLTIETDAFLVDQSLGITLTARNTRFNHYFYDR